MSRNKNQWDALAEMASQDKDIRYFPLNNITNINKNKITIGVDNETAQQLMQIISGVGGAKRLVGGLFVADAAQFAKMEKQVKLENV